MKIKKRIIGELAISLGVILAIAAIASFKDPIVTQQTQYVIDSNPTEHITVYTTYPSGGIYNFVYVMIVGLSLLGVIIIVAAYQNKPFVKFTGIIAVLTVIVATFVGIFNAYSSSFDTIDSFNTVRRTLRYNYDDTLKILLIGWCFCTILFLFYWGSRALKKDNEG